MTQVTHPTPQQVREYFKQRQKAGTPPPTPEEIRRKLGWGLIRPERTDKDCPR